ncbi:hypothetical protein POX_c04609 [Penicillium oxalicum]|uniref:hypothetical protein n=1 Tax=Penicillium oxalicum TaxID=69781 RepID=UPI0020B7081C|nr:hypothetical protein POX_c04609 [Penicillium oxalicum]KAI2791733.1 hypothetical protein POX_c04609 [Penicillium oxalicum]
MVTPELGTFANPIVIEDNLSPLNSASDPDMTRVNDGRLQDEPDQLGSDADTEIMTTPEFWGSLTGGNFAHLGEHEAAVDPFSIHVSIRSPVHEDLTGLPSFEQFQPDHKAFQFTRNSFDNSFGAARMESAMKRHGGSEQSMNRGKASGTEGPKKDPSVPDTFPVTRNAAPQEISIQADKAFGKGFSSSPYDMGPTKPRLSLEPADNINEARFLGKTALAWGSSISTAIGDELAAIHDHMEHCRKADCLQAKAFFDGIQPPQSSLPSHTNRSAPLQGRNDEGRVTMRFHVPGFQRGLKKPMEFLVNQVIIRTAFFPLEIPCSLETFRQDDILFGRGAAVISLEGKSPRFFVTFSPRVHQNDYGTQVRASRKQSEGIVIIESAGPQRKKGANWWHGFTGRVSIELYRRWPPLASDYEEREDFFGPVVLSVHSDNVDPKFFLSFSSGLSSADHNPHSPAPGQGVSAPSMASDTITQETTEQAGTSVDNLPLSSHVACVKRKFLSDGFQFQPRRSKRLAKKALIQQ